MLRDQTVDKRNAFHFAGQNSVFLASVSKRGYVQSQNHNNNNNSNNNHNDNNVFYSHANETHFYSAISLVLKVRVFGTHEWPILPPPLDPGG